MSINARVIFVAARSMLRCRGRTTCASFRHGGANAVIEMLFGSSHGPAIRIREEIWVDDSSFWMEWGPPARKEHGWWC